jgi:hypothetical protein
MSQQGEPETIDRDYVRLLMVMRRFVRDEFDIKVAISEPDAAATLLDYASRSRNEVLQEMGKELRELLTPAVDESKKEKVHYYRGVAQVVTAHEEEAATSSPPTNQRIYRGRVVAG